MADSVDRILGLIDDAVQSSPERGHGADARGLCARCQHQEPAEGGDLCQGCRAFLLEDSDQDPAERRAEGSWLEQAHRALGEAQDEIDEIYRDALDAHARHARRHVLVLRAREDAGTDQSRSFWVTDDPGPYVLTGEGQGVANG